MDTLETPRAERKGLMIRLECTLSKHGKTFLAACDQLGVSDQGRTAEEAMHNLGTSLTLFLKEFQQPKVLEEVLNARGVQFTLIHADHVLPELMDVPQVLAEVGTVGTSSTASTGRNKTRRISVPAYLWAY